MNTLAWCDGQNARKMMGRDTASIIVCKRLAVHQTAAMGSYDQGIGQPRQARYLVTSHGTVLRSNHFIKKLHRSLAQLLFSFLKTSPEYLMIPKNKNRNRSFRPYLSSVFGDILSFPILIVASFSQINEQAYTVEYLGNVAGTVEEGVRYINVPIEKLRQYTKMQLDRGDAVWFGCDVGKHFSRTMAVMDTNLFDYDLVYGTKPTMDKVTRLKYGDSLMTQVKSFVSFACFWSCLLVRLDSRRGAFS